MIPKTPSERLRYFKSNNFKNEEVEPFLIAHVEAYKKLNPKKKKGIQFYKENNHPTIHPILGEIIFILIEKIVNGPEFVRYSEDWKLDFKTIAYEDLCKYCHNFDKKKAGAITYLTNNAKQAMFRQLAKCKEQRERFPEHSIEAYSNVNDIDGNTYYPPELVTHLQCDLI